jgi:hypothetical protein
MNTFKKHVLRSIFDSNTVVLIPNSTVMYPHVLSSNVKTISIESTDNVLILYDNCSNPAKAKGPTIASTSDHRQSIGPFAFAGFVVGKTTRTTHHKL